MAMTMAMTMAQSGSGSGAGSAGSTTIISMADEAQATTRLIPRSATAASGIVACMRCTLAKTREQFFADGCENCEMLKMRDDMARVRECTTEHVLGLMAVIDPKESWMCKWQGTASCVPGIYGVKLIGNLPQHIIGGLIRDGYHYPKHDEA